MSLPRRILTSLAGATVVAVGLASCRQDMHDQPRYEPLEESPFFEDGRASRPLIPGTVARGHLEEDDHFYRGLEDGEPATSFPMELDMALLERGRERYDIFCSACHDRAGDGRGMVVQRGFPQPSSFHIERLREAPPGYTFDVITNGFGRMFDYADRIPAGDRWAIVAYVRALQLARNARPDDVPADVRLELAEVGQ